MFRASFGDHLSKKKEVRKPKINHLWKKKQTYVLNEINKTVTGSFRSNKASTPVNTFTSKHTGKLVLQFFVSTEKVADLSSAGSNITSYPTQEKNA